MCIGILAKLKALEVLRLVRTAVRAYNNALVLNRLGTSSEDQVEGNQGGMQSTCLDLVACEGLDCLALTS